MGIESPNNVESIAPDQKLKHLYADIDQSFFSINYNLRKWDSEMKKTEYGGGALEDWTNGLYIPLTKSFSVLQEYSTGFKHWDFNYLVCISHKWTFRNKLCFDLYPNNSSSSLKDKERILSISSDIDGKPTIEFIANKSAKLNREDVNDVLTSVLGYLHWYFNLQEWKKRIDKLEKIKIKEFEESEEKDIDKLLACTKVLISGFSSSHTTRSSLFHLLPTHNSLSQKEKAFWVVGGQLIGKWASSISLDEITSYSSDNHSFTI